MSRLARRPSNLHASCGSLTTRPRKTSASMEPDALTAAANDQRPDAELLQSPMKSHLFHMRAGARSKAAPPPPDALRAVDEIKAVQPDVGRPERKAAKAAAEQTASTPAPIITEEHHELPELVHVDPLPTKKASKPATTKKPAPDVLRKAEREAKAAFLAVPETDRKGQAAALDAWRKTRKAVEDAKQASAAVAAPDEAPVKQLDFESIAAGLLA